MVYLRSKKVKGHIYYYVVRSVRKGDKIRQVTIQYLGSKKPNDKEVKKLKEVMKKLRKPKKERKK